VFRRKQPRGAQDWSWVAVDADQPQRAREHERYARLQSALVRIDDCTVLGGYGLRPTSGEVWDLVFEKSALTFFMGNHPHGGSVPYRAITALEIGGPGEITTGTHFSGFGFGLAGVAQGVLMASALNMLTTRRRIDTAICLQTATAELFLHNGVERPDVMRIRLSPIFSLLRQQSGAAADLQSTGSARRDTSTIDDLAKLADLLAKGLITADEFATLKSDLLKG